MTWVNILVALATRREARAIVCQHFSASSRGIWPLALLALMGGVAPIVGLIAFVNRANIELAAPAAEKNVALADQNTITIIPSPGREAHITNFWVNPDGSAWVAYYETPGNGNRIEVIGGGGGGHSTYLTSIQVDGEAPAVAWHAYSSSSKIEVIASSGGGGGGANGSAVSGGGGAGGVYVPCSNCAR